jgi:hypothetical protein
MRSRDAVTTAGVEFERHASTVSRWWPPNHPPRCTNATDGDRQKGARLADIVGLTRPDRRGTAAGPRSAVTGVGAISTTQPGRLRLLRRRSIICDMKKSPTTHRTIASARRTASKAASEKLVVVKKAAQRPTHASRAVIRRAVRAVAAECPQANA